MDIVTHAMLGAIAASPFAASQPEAAAAFVFGSVAPDLDACSRLFGRKAFLAAHQTWSHALPVIAVVGGLAWVAREVCGVYAPWAPLALALGMALHALLDWTNTYGITLLAPFSRRRLCREWVFFVDAFVIASCLGMLGVLAWRLAEGRPLGWGFQLGWGCGLVGYGVGRVALRRRARRVCPPGTLSLVPSALVPWVYLGCARQGDEVLVFRVDALTQTVFEVERVRVLDADHRALLASLPEWRVMRSLSPAYHLVSRDEHEGGARLVCRDLRTRNFATRFGQLELQLDSTGAVAGRVFHV